MKQILIDKSIEKERVVYKPTSSLISQYIFSYFLALIPLVASSLILLNHKVNTPPAAIIIMMVINLWIFVGLFLTNKLIKIQGYLFTSDKTSIINILSKRYPNINFSSGNPDLIRGQRAEGWTGRGKIISVILDEQDIYINVVSTFRGGVLSFIDAPFNYIASKRIARSFVDTVHYQMN